LGGLSIAAWGAYVNDTHLELCRRSLKDRTWARDGARLQAAAERDLPEPPAFDNEDTKDVTT